MTVAWIYDQPLNPEAGGTERITSLVAKGLESCGHTCLGILVFDHATGKVRYSAPDGGREVEVKDLYGFLQEHGVDVVINQIAYAKWLLEAFLKQGGARWRAEGGRIVSCHHFNPETPPLSDFYRSLLRKTWRDRINYAKSLLLAPYYKRRHEREEGEVFRYIYDHSDAFVTLSAGYHPYVKRVMGRSELPKLKAINNPLTFDTVLTAADMAQKKKEVLVCSRIVEYQKRISLVLKIWEKVRRNPVSDDWTLKIVGEGKDKAYYVDYARRKGLTNIEFLDRQDPMPHYRTASMLMLTSNRAEGWGLTLTESLQTGTVPLAFDTYAAVREIIQDGENGFLLRDGDLDGYAKAVTGLMANPARLTQLQLAALRSADRFSPASTTPKWQSLLHEIGNGRKQ